MNDLVNSLVNSILDAFDRLKEFLSDAWETNKPLVLAVSALVVLIFLGLIVLIAMPRKKNTGPQTIPASVEFFLEYPSEPDFADEYILEKKETVVEESFINDWFSPVDGEMMENLGHAAHTVTESILEAVP